MRKNPHPTAQALEGALVQTFKAIRLTPIPDKDPLHYIEARRLEYIRKIEEIANAAAELWADCPNPAVRKAYMEVDLKATAYLTRLTSVYKTRVDVTASNLGLLKAPQLDHATPQQLAALERGEEVVLRELQPGEQLKEEDV